MTNENTVKYIAGLAMIGLLAVSPGWAKISGSAEKELVDLEHAWKQAVVTRDAAALRRFYADEYMTTDQEGLVWTKAEDIEIDTSGIFRLLSYSLQDMNVRLYGDVAVVTGRMDSKGKLQLGDHIDRETSGSHRFTDVFVRRDGRWQCVANQQSATARN